MIPIPNRMAVATIVISTLTEQSFKNTLHEALCARDLTQFFLHTPLEVAVGSIVISISEMKLLRLKEVQLFHYHVTGRRCQC